MQRKFILKTNYKNLKHQITEIQKVDEYATDKAYTDALEFIIALPSEMVSHPNLMVAEDGDVMFIWGDWQDKTNLYIDLGFFGDGTYSFYATEGQNSIAKDDVPSHVIDSQLQNALITGKINEN